VKYKSIAAQARDDPEAEDEDNSSAPWNPRSDLNQLLGFAAIAETDEAVLCRMAPAVQEPLITLTIGKVTITYLFWPTSVPEPKDAADAFRKQARDWYRAMNERERIRANGLGSVPA
jgi:hypothetical protein